MERAQEILKQYFGYDTFREGQAELIQAVCQGRDVLGIMPTGGGKSLCYQVPALLLPGVTLVISPLISLMKDQVTALAQAGVPAAFLGVEGQTLAVDPADRMELRRDEIRPSLRREVVLQNAPQSAAGCIVVPKTVE